MSFTVQYAEALRALRDEFGIRDWSEQQANLAIQYAAALQILPRGWSERDADLAIGYAEALRELPYDWKADASLAIQHAATLK